MFPWKWIQPCSHSERIIAPLKADCWAGGPVYCTGIVQQTCNIALWNIKHSVNHHTVGDIPGTSLTTVTYGLKIKAMQKSSPLLPLPLSETQTQVNWLFFLTIDSAAKCHVGLQGECGAPKTLRNMQVLNVLWFNSLFNLSVVLLFFLTTKKKRKDLKADFLPFFLANPPTIRLFEAKNQTS